jgi:hypothetical protein
VLGWLRSRSVEELGALTVRDIHRTRGKGTTAAEVRATLRVLEDHGYIRVEKPSTGKRGRPAELVHVNPAISESLATDPTNPTESGLEGVSVRSVGSDAKESGTEHSDPDCHETRAWRARDGRWRCTACMPPAFPGETLEERAR